MASRNHSPLLKLFIFFLVALMIFSAVGIMILYMGTPQEPNGTQETIGTGEQLPAQEAPKQGITIPSFDTTTGDTTTGEVTGTGTN